MNDSGATRWKQRFENFLKALSRLQEAVELEQQKPLPILSSKVLLRRLSLPMSWPGMS